MADTKRSRSNPSESHAGLELFSSAVVLADDSLRIRYLESGAENLFAVSFGKLLGAAVRSAGNPAELEPALSNALNNNWSYTGHDLRCSGPAVMRCGFDCTVTQVETDGSRQLLLEFRPIDAQLRVAREEQLLQQQQANRELIRNPRTRSRIRLGGIRARPQLLAEELNDPALQEYTEVIIAEADRLQDLMNRLLRAPR